MRRFYPIALLTAASLMLVVAGTAIAQQASESAPVYAGHAYYDVITGTTTFQASQGSRATLAGDVYNNTNPLPSSLAGFSSTDLNATFGDRVTTTGLGTLDQNDFTIFNSSTGNTGSLLTAVFNINLFDAATNTLIGGYSTLPVSFGAGLAPGFFSIVTVTGLSSLSITLPTTDILMTQQVGARTGASVRLGVVLADPPTIGSSFSYMYINATTVGPAGYYNIGTATGNANPGYRINLIQATPAQSSTWGRLKSLYR